MICNTSYVETVLAPMNNRNQNFSQKRHKHKNQGKKHPSAPQKNKVYDSTGPFGSKVRGTAQQIHEKYSSLARDAYTSGDRSNYESYAQHAEHYSRELQKINLAHAETQRQQAEAQAAIAAQKQSEAEARIAKEESAKKTEESNVSKEKSHDKVDANPADAPQKNTAKKVDTNSTEKQQPAPAPAPAPKETKEAESNSEEKPKKPRKKPVKKAADPVDVPKEASSTDTPEQQG